MLQTLSKFISEDGDPLTKMVITITMLSNTFTFIYEQFCHASPDNSKVKFKPGKMILQFLRVLQVYFFIIILVHLIFYLN